MDIQPNYIILMHVLKVWIYDIFVLIHICYLYAIYSHTSLTYPINPNNHPPSPGRKGSSDADDCDVSFGSVSETTCAACNGKGMYIAHLLLLTFDLNHALNSSYMTPNIASHHLNTSHGKSNTRLSNHFSLTPLFTRLYFFCPIGCLPTHKCPSCSDIIPFSNPLTTLSLPLPLYFPPCT